MAKPKTRPGQGGSSAQIEHLPVSSLVPYARNSRTHSETQIAQIAASITEFGFCNPVLIDKDGGIIAGHGRVMAATLLGMDTIPCLRLSHLTEAQKRAYVIADNQLALNSGWDDEVLKLELADLKLEDFDLDLLGVDEIELTLLVGLDEEAHEPELPAINGTTSHTVVVRYYPDDVAIMCDWLGVEVLPEKLGVAIREKILESASDQ